jgi:hypothetical protein
LQNQNISCFGSASGSASVTANGGTPPYFYEWSSGHVTSLAEQLFSGSYFIQVTDSRGCSVIDSLEILENNEIISQLTSTPTSCFGSFDGSATISSVGGTGNLTYTWSNGENTSSITSGFGEYWVITEDEIGCITEDTILINQPQKIRTELSIDDVSCYGGTDGKIEASIIGGNPFPNDSYTCTWTLNDDTVGYNYYILNSISSSEFPYVLNIVDYSGCTHTSYAFIDEPPAIDVAISEIIPAYCQNIPTGQASVVASGGFLNPDGMYSYSWTTGDSGSVLSNQNSGLYNVIVKDDNNCQGNLFIEIPLEDNFILDINSTSLICNDDSSGTATVSCTGGFGPYTYDWNTSLGLSQQISSASNNTILNLSHGITSVVVTDVNGCTKTTQINIDQPNELVYTITKLNNESCSGQYSSCDGVLQYTASGGSGAYSFSTFDLNGSLISENFSDSLVIDSSLCSGFYQVLVEDDHGCIGNLSGNGLPLPVEIIAGSPVTSAINTSPGSITNNILCFGDTAASLSVSNPNPSYLYDWYVNGEMYASGLNVILPAGNIYVQAVSSTSCFTNSDTITIFQPSDINISQEIGFVSCSGGNDGLISVEVSGGFPSYSYNWTIAGTPIVGTTNLTGLSSGVYNLIITDANDCHKNFDIEVQEPSALIVGSVVEDVSCNGENDGSASISISGGVDPYMINWQGVDSTSLAAGIYEVIITDANNCIETLDVEVNQPTSVVASFNVNQIPFTASASGGTPPYSFEWLYFGNYQSSGTIFNPEENGEYTLVATDANDCEGRKLNTYSSTVDLLEFEDLDFLVYPNPVVDYLYIKSKSESISEDCIFKLLDYRGRVIEEDFINGLIKINTNNFTPGVYFLVIESDENKFQKKILIE